MSAVPRLVFSIFGIGLCILLALSRGDQLTDDIIAMEFAAFGSLFFLWWGWGALKELRKGR
ncbi:MAG: hypothetical protein AAGJ96_06790 [Pseudomonadota bacterium]